MKHLVISFLSILLVVCPVVVNAAWNTNGTAIAVTTGDQLAVTVAPDGSGGAIMTWEDHRGTSADIYARRINASGVGQWGGNGIALCTAAFDQTSPQIVSDGAGGAIVVWADGRNGTDDDIYAQRVNGSGVRQWATNGVALSVAAENQGSLMVVSDGAGGAIVAWSDYRNPPDYHIYAQRVDASGVVQWTTDGVAVSLAAHSQLNPAIQIDGSGGAILAWDDFRNGVNWDIYAQRVDNTGVTQWTANGVALCTAANDQNFPRIATDGAGGGIVTWYDVRNGATSDIYVQRVNTSGAVQWTANGVALCAAAGNQYYPTIASDDAGGAIVAWSDNRGADGDIYARRVNSTGVPQWTANGVLLCAAVSDQFSPQIIADGASGAVVTWEDTRFGTFSDVYVQRINATGSVQWMSGGAPLCTAPDDQTAPMIITDTAGGAIVTWTDYRNHVDGDVYAQHIFNNGNLPTGVATQTPPLSIEVGDNIPNPFSSDTRIELLLRHDADVRVEVFDVAGRRVRALDLGRRGKGASEFRFDGHDDSAHALPSGVYFYRVQAGNETVTKKMVIAH